MRKKTWYLYNTVIKIDIVCWCLPRDTEISIKNGSTLPLLFKEILKTTSKNPQRSWGSILFFEHWLLQVKTIKMENTQIIFFFWFYNHILGNSYRTYWNRVSGSRHQDVRYSTVCGGWTAAALLSVGREMFRRNMFIHIKFILWNHMQVFKKDYLCTYWH